MLDIAFLTNVGKFTGGKTRSTRIQRLLKKDYNIHQIDIRPSSEHDIPGDIEGSRHHIHIEFLPRSINLLLTSFYIPFVCRRMDTDLIYTYNSLEHSTISAWLASVLCGVPLVVGVNDPRKGDGLLDTIVHKYLRQEVLKRADSIVLLTENLRSDLSNDIEDEKITIVLNGIDPTSYECAESPSTDKPIVFYVGRAFDIDLIFESAQLVSERIPEVEFRLAGVDENDFPSVESDAITFLGYISHEELCRELARAHVSVVPYTKKDTAGEPIKITEYMSAKSCIVATDLGYNTSLLVDRENAILTEPNKEDFAEGIRLALNNEELRNELATNARRDIEGSLEKMHDRLKSAIELAAV